MKPVSLPPFGSTFTISCRIQPAVTSAGDCCIASWGSAASGNVGNFFRLEADNYLYYGQWNGSFKKVKSKIPLINRKWQYVALVKDNNTVRIYIDGVESTGSYVSGAAPMDNNTSGDAFRFGGMYQNNAFQQGFSGEINNLAFYTSARTSQQIADEFTNGVTTTEAALWGYWDFNDQASPATDKTAYAHTLTLENAAYKLKSEDWTEGLLESINFDQLRVVAREDAKIELENQDAYIDPVPTGGGGGVSEPVPEKLSIILDEFNQLFGAIDWQYPDDVRQQILELPEQLVQNEAFRNAARFSDQDTAQMECNSALQDIIIRNMAAQSELSRYFLENEQFRAFLTDRVFSQAFPMVNI